MNQTEIAIDYLQFNIKNWRWIAPQASKFKPSFLAHYQDMYTDSSGITYHIGNPRTDKCHVIVTGLACARLFDALPPQTFIKLLLDNGATVTRLDVALTEFVVDEQPYTSDDIMLALRNDMIACKHVKHGAKLIADAQSNNAETLYIGDMQSRGKRGIVRAYDKGLRDFNLDRYLINRIEIEDKRDDAQVSASRLASGDSLESVFKSRFDIPNDERFQQMLGNAIASTSRPKSRESATAEDYAMESSEFWAWASGNIATAIGRRIYQDYKNDAHPAENYEAFIDAIKSAMYREQDREN